MNLLPLPGVVEQCLYWQLRNLRLKLLLRIATAPGLGSRLSLAQDVDAPPG